MLRLSHIVLITFVLAASACQKPADDKIADKGSSAYGLDVVENGKLSYDRYCVACHGSTGIGDGPVAPELITKPTDLTILGEKYDGVFPESVVYDYIDGRKNVAAHGTRMMPVWGNIWTEQQGEETVGLRIKELVAYVESIQKTDE